MSQLRLLRPLERVIASGHPWIYRDALSGDAAPGEVVTVVNRKGRFVCRGIADAGPIGMRVFTTRDEPLEPLFASRLARAFELRRGLLEGGGLGDTDTYRLVHGEGDRLPGVVVDRYGSHATLRFDGQGATAWRDAVIAALQPLLASLEVTALITRQGRKRQIKTEVAFGEVADQVVVREHGMKLLFDPRAGQKTGLFLDHRETRRLVRGMSRGKRVLNLYGYTGGFSVAAGLGGATAVTTVDIAPRAIDLASETFAANDLPAARHEGIASDVPAYLEGETRRPVDLIVCDPPSFAPNEDALGAALEKYRELHRQCLGRLRPGGIYVAASCSSHVNRSAFDATLTEGAKRARKMLQVLGRFGAPIDHPRLLAFPEGDYLKVVIARVL